MTLTHPGKAVQPKGLVREPLFPLAVRPVLLIAAAVAIALLLTSPRYGYFADELYFIAAGHHLAWGYADQPPLIPLIASTLDTLFPGSLVALRIPPMLVTAAGVVVTALIARELGGDRRAQMLAAGAWAVTVQFASAGHLLATWSFDPFLWTVICWLVVRWTRCRRDHLLLWAGVITAVALQVKFLIPVWWLCVGVAALATGPRELLRRPMLWCGAGFAALTMVPTLLWQHAHGWPQLRMPAAIAAENWYGWLFLPTAVACAGLVGGAAACYGSWRLLRSPNLHPYRYLGWAAVGTTAIFLLADGRPYYVAGLFGLLYAVAAVEAPKFPGWLTGTAFAVSACLALAALPVLPVSSIQRFDTFGRGSIGWPQLTSAVADAYHRAPPRTAVITHDYWSAGSLHHYGSAAGIPEAYSGSRGFWYLGRPPEDTEHVLYLGGTREYLLRSFRDVRPMTTVDTPLDTYYEGTTIWLASGPRRPWAELWPQFRRMGIFDGTTGSGTELPGAQTTSAFTAATAAVPS
ncbi:ArnT family glycosyltransferase [Saccharopolyspora sp. 5N102]|uniref:ArnT family glycosyltransferase n=1 Tax=Saccharopolyspora sp. 5N102 TaxID=3375155 RepID=UPI0037BDDDDC